MTSKQLPFGKSNNCSFLALQLSYSSLFYFLPSWLSNIVFNCIDLPRQNVLHESIFWCVSTVTVKPYLEATSQELVLHLQEVAFVGLRSERLVDDGELGVVLDVLPSGVTVTGTEGGVGVKDHFG